MLVALVKMNPAKLHRPKRDRPRGNVREALRHIADRRELRVPLLLMLVLSTIGFNFQVVIPLLADRSLRRRRLRLFAADGRDGRRLDHRRAHRRHARTRVSRELITPPRSASASPRCSPPSAPPLPLEMLALGAARRLFGDVRGRDQLGPAARRRAGDARPGDGRLLDRLPRLDRRRRADHRLARRGDQPAGAARRRRPRRLRGRDRRLSSPGASATRARRPSPASSRSSPGTGELAVAAARTAPQRAVARVRHSHPIRTARHRHPRRPAGGPRRARPPLAGPSVGGGREQRVEAAPELVGLRPAVAEPEAGARLIEPVAGTDVGAVVVEQRST